MRPPRCSIVIVATLIITACASRPLPRYVVASELPASKVMETCQKTGIPRSFDLRHTGRSEAALDVVYCKPEGKGQELTIYARSGEDIRLAVIRTIISFIREEKPDHFEWSGWSGKMVVLSSRLEDQGRLEAFLLGQFYPSDPRAVALPPVVGDT